MAVGCYTALVLEGYLLRMRYRFLSFEVDPKINVGGDGKEEIDL